MNVNQTNNNETNETNITNQYGETTSVNNIQDNNQQMIIDGGGNKKLIIGIAVIVCVLSAGFLFVGNSKVVDKEPIEPPIGEVEVISKKIDDVKISGYGCTGNNCIIYLTLKDSEEEIECIFAGENLELIKVLSNYMDYIKVDIYVSGEGNDISIVEYDVYSKSTGEKFTNIKTENELRLKLGMLVVGTYTKELIFSKIGSSGIGEDELGEFAYKNYEFYDYEDNDYVFKYISRDFSFIDGLLEATSYNVKFEVNNNYEFILLGIE